MFWSRVVWIERDEEFEETVPHNWIKGNRLYWPKGLHVNRAYYSQEEPTEEWLSFNVVKVKLHKGDKDVCDQFGEHTTTYEDDEDDEEDFYVQKTKKDKSVKSQSTIVKKPAPMPVFTGEKTKRFKSERKSLSSSSFSSLSKKNISASSTSSTKSTKFESPLFQSSPASSSICALEQHTQQNVSSSTVVGSPSAAFGLSLPGACHAKSIAEDVDSNFPMSITKFQKTVMTTLTELKVTQQQLQRTQESILKKLERGATLPTPQPDAILDSAPLSSLEEFLKFDQDLREEDKKFKQLVREMVRIGGEKESSCVRKTLDSVMEPGLQAKFNLKGSVKRNIEKKEAFGNTMIYKAIVKATKKLFDTSTDLTVRKTICKTLKYVPDRVQTANKRRTDEDDDDEDNEGQVPRVDRMETDKRRRIDEGQNEGV